MPSTTLTESVERIAIRESVRAFLNNPDGTDVHAAARRLAFADPLHHPQPSLPARGGIEDEVCARLDDLITATHAVGIPQCVTPPYPLQVYEV